MIVTIQSVYDISLYVLSYQTIHKDTSVLPDALTRLKSPYYYSGKRKADIGCYLSREKERERDVKLSYALERAYSCLIQWHGSEITVV